MRWLDATPGDVFIWSSNPGERSDCLMLIYRNHDFSFSTWWNIQQNWIINDDRPRGDDYVAGSIIVLGKQERSY